MIFKSRYTQFAIKNMLKWCVGVTTTISLYNYYNVNFVDIDSMVEGILIQSILAPFFMFFFMPITLSKMMQDDHDNGKLKKLPNYNSNPLVYVFPKNKTLFVITGILFALTVLALPSIAAVSYFIDGGVTGFEYVIFKMLSATLYASFIATIISMNVMTNFKPELIPNKNKGFVANKSGRL